MTVDSQPQGQLPDHALDVEQALICACLVDLTLVDGVGLEPKQFFGRAERTVWETLVDLRGRGLAETDLVQVADDLRRRGRLVDVGGTPGLGRMVELAPAVADVAPLAQVVREAATVRELDALLARARLRARAGGRREELLADVAQLLDQGRELASGARTGAGLPTADVGDIPDELPPTPWVCERLHLAPGRPACLVGYAGAGKTLLAADLALAVSARDGAGVTFWGGLVPDRRGRVLLLDFEVGRELTQRRLLRLAAGRWGSLRDWSGRLEYSCFPRWSLMAPKAEEQLVETLRGRVLCIIDSLTAITPGADENGREMADHMALLTRVSEATGCAILVLHHEGKPPQDGPRAAHLRGRGSSAIQGIWSSQWAVTSLGEGRLQLEQGKTQFEGGQRPQVHCQICDVHGEDGRQIGVRLAPVGPGDGASQAQGEAGAPPVPPGVLGKAKSELLAILGALGRTNVSDLLARMSVGKHTKYRALEALQAEGKIVKVTDPKDTRRLSFELARDTSRPDREGFVEADRDGSRCGSGGIS